MHVTAEFELDASIHRRYEWVINVPTQTTTHDNSAWQEVNVYAPPLNIIFYLSAFFFLVAIRGKGMM